MKKIFMSIIIIILVVIFTVPASAIIPYQNYIYDHNKLPQEEPQAVIPSTIITGASLNTTDFNNPQDIFVAKDGRIYIADTGNNRILVIDSNYKLLKSITGFINSSDNNKQDTFNAPTGLCVSKDNNLYIADSLNGRIVELNNDGALVWIFGRPVTPLITNQYPYVPLKIAVDSAKRLSIVAKNQEKGIIQIENDGSFIGFFGALPTPPDLYNMIIRLIGTPEMKKSMVLNISTVYSNIAIDSADFLYGTVGSVDVLKYDVSAMLVRKINPMGTDILKRFGNVPVAGDLKFFDQSVWPPVAMAPYIVDIAVNNKGLYSILETRTGHIFTYNDNGNLLYTFGILGSINQPRIGQFGIPSAIDYLNNNDFVVLDSQFNQLDIFKLTEYGSMITNIVEKYYFHDYTDVDKYWKTALKYTSKSELLYNNIGEAFYKQNNYIEAMKYFKLAENRTKYSDAYQYYRKAFMSKYFSSIMIVIIILIVIIIVVTQMFKRYNRRGGRQN